MKSSEEFEAHSQKGQELARKNKHPHLLGTSGYVGAKKKWDKEDDEAEKYGQEPVFPEFLDDVRLRQWCRAAASESETSRRISRLSASWTGYQTIWFGSMLGSTRE